MMIELNEFDPSLLRSAALRLKLRNILAALDFSHSRTTTQERVEHQGLDPWVQWASIHSGVPADVHGVTRLGATRTQGRQVWNMLGRAGIPWGVWGSINAPLGDALCCQFFMPDPWSFDESAYPPELAGLLELPRYVSKNYLGVSPRAVLTPGIHFLRYLSKPSIWRISFRFIRAALYAVRLAGLSVHTMSTLLDYLSAMVFVHLRRRSETEFSIIFLNHIAHLQHQFWTPGERLHPQMELGLRTCDSILGILLKDRRENESILIANGLRQENVFGQGFVCYRQRSPAHALQALGIPDAHVEQCMTNDAHVLFRSDEAAARAESILKRATLSSGGEAFYVERSGPTSVFYQLSVDRAIPSGTVICTPEHAIAFDEVFELVTARTGAHIPEGDIFASGIDVPKQLPNHDIYGVIARYFSIERDTALRPGAGKT